MTIDQLRDAINTLTEQIDRLDARIANLTDALHCQRCPVLAQCDTFAAANREKDGFVWGGRTR